jgi:hypothetical protein
VGWVLDRRRACFFTKLTPASTCKHNGNLIEINTMSENAFEDRAERQTESASFRLVHTQARRSNGMHENESLQHTCCAWPS